MLVGLVGALDEEMTISPDVIEAMNRRTAQEAEEVLSRAKKTLKSGGITAEIVLVQGDAATEIVKLVKEEAYDMVVMGSRGLGRFQGLVLGSVSSKVVHMAPCAVLVVR